MKKILLITLAMVMCAGNAMAFDNEPEEGLTWVGLFGVNVSKLQNTDYKAKGGVMMGIRGDYMLPGAHGTYVTAGLDWTMKGGKQSEDIYVEGTGTALKGTAKCPLHYFEVPIRFGFRYNILDILGLYGEVGPYFAVGVGGKHKMSIEGDGEIINEAEDQLTYKAFKKTSNIAKVNNFQRWDAGIGFRIGAEYNNHYNLMLGCDWGLADMYRDKFRDTYYDYYKELGFDESLPKVHNFNFSITLGYRF